MPAKYWRLRTQISTLNEQQSLRGEHQATIMAEALARTVSYKQCGRNSGTHVVMQTTSATTAGVLGSVHCVSCSPEKNICLG